MASIDHQASPPSVPAATPEQQRAAVPRSARRVAGEQVERRSQLRGLLLLALAVLAASIARAAAGSVFPPGWWRIW